jgi:hypothetical protein
MNEKIRIRCLNPHGRITATIPDGWKVVKAKGEEKPLKSDRAFHPYDRTFKPIARWELEHAVKDFFKVIRRIHKKKVA